MSVPVSVGAAARALRDLGLYWYAERLERAGLSAELRPALHETRTAIQAVRATLEHIGSAPRQVEAAGELEHLLSVLSQRIQRRSA